jgi:histidyl-tRNA synthetase
MEINSLKGFYDRYPDEWSSWKKLIETVDETAEEFGFRQIDTPNLEKADLYRVKSGEELMDQMYNFEDKGGREVSLIPEQTPTRARLVQQRKDLKTPIKWYDTSKRWRYENVQKGRDREFFQGDFDIFGVESVEADAEVIAAAAEIYRKLNLENRVRFKISDRQILEKFLRLKDVPEVEEVMQVIDDEEKMSRDEFLEELEEIGLKQEDIRKVDEIKDISGSFDQQLDELEKIAPKELEGRVDRMRELRDSLDAYGVLEMCELDFSIVRGLAYYTGLVFEAFDSEGELRALFGGGRYDDLVGLFGSQQVPAVGFAFGYSTTVELLKKEDRWPLKQVETDVYVLSVSESVREVAIEYSQKLREEGLSVETDISGRGFGSQLDYADSINAERVLIVGERDLENDEVTMKHMDSGEEETVDRDSVVEHLEGEDVL